MNSERTFEIFWKELVAILPPESLIGKYYGKPFNIVKITNAEVTIRSSEMANFYDIPKETFEVVYADWNNYRYENLTQNNSNETLFVISIIDYIIQTWRRQKERDSIIEKVQKVKINDGVFWIVNYNRNGRTIGPRPIGPFIPLNEVFPDQSASSLVELEVLATRLYEECDMFVKSTYGDKNTDVKTILMQKYPGFCQEVYNSVIYQALVLDR